MKKSIKIGIGILLIIINIGTMNVSEKVELDKIEGKKLLKETYAPLENFAKKLKFSKDKKLLLLPSNVKSEEDFIHLFDKKMKEHNAEGFYEDLIIQKGDELFVDPLAYIPTIYAKDSIVARAYIKETENLFLKLLGKRDKKRQELIIKERWLISGQWHKRTNYYVKNQNEKWILDHGNGTSVYGFVNINNNPWHEYWKEVE